MTKDKTKTPDADHQSTEAQQNGASEQPRVNLQSLNGIAITPQVRDQLVGFLSAHSENNDHAKQLMRAIERQPVRTIFWKKE